MRVECKEVRFFVWLCTGEDEERTQTTRALCLNHGVSKQRRTLREVVSEALRKLLDPVRLFVRGRAANEQELSAGFQYI